MKVLFILQDALRADHMGCYGYPKDTTPNIDRVVREGILFENSIAVSTHTFPPIVSINTGQTVATHRLMSAADYDRWKNGNLWSGRRTPLHVLADNGILVDGELVMRWAPLGFKRDTVDVDAYFEENRDKDWFFFAEPYNTHLPYNPPQSYYDLFVDKDFRPDEATLKRLEIVRSRMIIHPHDVRSALEVGQKDSIGLGDKQHERSAAVAEFDPKDKPGITALYDGEVRVFDDLVGRWLIKLEKLGILDETLIIITADHGEELLERGHVGHSSCNLKGTLFDECLKVPLIMRYPPKLRKGTVIRHQVSQIDIMPTIFDILGRRMPPGTDGSTLLPLVNRNAESFREESYAESIPAGWQALEGDHRRTWCVRTNDWKLIHHSEAKVGGSQRRYELFDLRSDPGETCNLFERQGTKAAELREKLEAHILRGT
jgi:arylsulfatase A-like enzyme